MYLCLGFIAFGLVVIGFLLGRLHHKKAVSRKMEDLAWYRKTILREQGSCNWPSFKIDSYEIWSLDGGKNWVAVEREGKELKILGLVEDVYPGLLRHRAAMDVLETGKLDGKPTTKEDKPKLEALGFEFRKKEAVS